MNYKLSDQALGALMIALQKSLMEQADIVPVLNDFDFRAGTNGKLYVENPPIIKFDNKDDEDEKEYG